MRFSSLIDARINGVGSARRGIGIEPWQTSRLESVVLADVLGPDALAGLPLDRARAMRVPAAARARHLIAGTIARLPLVVYSGAAPVPEQPGWAYRSDGQLGDGRYLAALPELVPMPQSLWARQLATIDDFLFYGVSLWLVTARAATGFPARMVHVPFDAWGFDGCYTNAAGEPITLTYIGDDGRQITEPIPPADLIAIPGPHAGLLDIAGPVLANAAEQERVAADVVRRPFRLELHQTTETPLPDDEIREMIRSVRKAMSENGGILFTNSALETKDHQITSSDLLIAGRNQSAVDIAREASIPASMLDASNAGASLTYETALTRNAEWLDYGLSLYIDALTARLSLDDIVPAGQRTGLDVSSLTSLPAPAGSPETRD